MAALPVNIIIGAAAATLAVKGCQDATRNTAENNNNYSKGYTEKDAAKDTGVKQKEVEKAWHDARSDAQKAGELPERQARKDAQEKRNKGDK